MVKKRGYIILAVFLIIFASVNLYLFFNKGSASYQNISGRFIEDIPKMPWNLNISIIAFVAQWIILLIVALVAYVRFMKKRKEEHVQLSYSRIKNKITRSETDLDILYNLLKEKKRLRIGLIAKTFKIKKENALEWGKILENYKLAIIEYPTFSEPEIRLFEKEKDETEKQKEREQEKKREEKDKQEKSENNVDKEHKEKTKTHKKHKTHKAAHKKSNKR